MYYVSLLRSSWRSMNEMDTQSAGKACNKDRGEERERATTSLFFLLNLKKKFAKLLLVSGAKSTFFEIISLVLLRATLVFKKNKSRLQELRSNFLWIYNLQSDQDHRALFSKNTKI